MRFLVLFRGALGALMKNKKRSFLTMIGIIIGIAAVSTVVAIGNGFERYVLDAFIPGEGDFITQQLYYNYNDWAMWENGIEAYSELDIEQVNQIEGVQEVSILQFNEEETMLEVNMEFETEDPWADNYKDVRFIEDRGSEVLLGRSLDEIDQERAMRSAVIPINFAYELKPDGDVESLLGSSLPLDKVTYTIVGISEGEVEFSEEYLFDEYSYTMDYIEIPKNSYSLYHQSASSSETLEIAIATGFVPSDVMREVQNFLETEGSMSEHGWYEFMDFSEEDDELAKVLAQITVFIACIAGISLFVAGIGIMNMMYISVSERTREIGIRRALGANQNTIRLQFILEGMLMTCLGGLIGYALGMGMAQLAATLLPFSIAIDLQTILLSLGISAVIGLVFSWAPANAASRKEIIEIL
jgi:putative ABC transport system permease protein